MDNSTIREIIDSCWYDSTSLEIELTEFEEIEQSEDLYITTVVFTGESEGSMTLVMGEVLAKNIAGKMFESETESVTYDDIKDSIGELVNILAGNMKTTYFGSSELSKPLVMQGSSAMLSVLKTDVIFQRRYLVGGLDELVIQVCQTD